MAALSALHSASRANVAWCHASSCRLHSTAWAFASTQPGEGLGGAGVGAVSASGTGT